MTDLQQHRCPSCGRFTQGHAGADQGSNETWYWSCTNCKIHGSEGY